MISKDVGVAVGTNVLYESNNNVIKKDTQSIFYSWMDGWMDGWMHFQPLSILEKKVILPYGNPAT